MSGVPPQERGAGQIRAIYEEYDLDATRVAMLSDPENEHAWIQSNETIPIEP